MGDMVGGVMGLGIGLIGLKMVSNMLDNSNGPKKRRRKKSKGIKVKY